MHLSDNEHFDTVIIGAGMSGLAAGIRLALFGQKVIILERHYAPGGLNSFYTLNGRKFDVGLHAVTNYVRPGVKGTPLVKLFRQLRIAREEFGLCEQYGSKVAFPGVEMRFTNDFEVLESEVAEKFPSQIDNFRRLLRMLMEFDELSLEGKELSARQIVGEYITDPLLEDMLFCPVMYYGSAKENDMDFAQFVIMFKSVFCEGFARPFEGVRRIVRVLRVKYRKLGGKRMFRCGVRALKTEGMRVKELELDNGWTITADNVVSSIGLVETLRLCDDRNDNTGAANVGRLSFVETISLLSLQPRELGWNDTIIFFNDSERFEYACPRKLVDPRSGVICFSNNYHYPDGKELDTGIFRITAMANFEGWTSMSEEEYVASKNEWFQRLTTQVGNFLPPLEGIDLEEITIYSDMFTPRTIKYYTGHLGGAVYGAPHKVKDGRTHLENLFICGTDQGFLGIVGAMLSGISMVNYHILRKQRRESLSDKL